MSEADNDLGELIRGQASHEFNRWIMPCFDEPDPDAQLSDADLEALAQEAEAAQALEAHLEAQSTVEDVADNTLQPITLEELEQIRQEAYQEAYNEGFAVGEKEGFHSGQLKAQHESEAVLTARLHVLEQLMQQLLEPIAQQDQALEHMLLELLIQLVREVIRRELVLDSSQVGTIVKEALKLLPMGADNIRIHVHPQDFMQIKALRERHEEQWRILEDDTLMPGGCRIETEHSQIDASIETRLQRVIDQLLEQHQEQTAHPPVPDLTLELGDSHAP